MIVCLGNTKYQEDVVSEKYKLSLQFLFLKAWKNRKFLKEYHLINKRDFQFWLIRKHEKGLFFTKCPLPLMIYMNSSETIFIPVPKSVSSTI